jgi:hypothetical protein
MSDFLFTDLKLEQEIKKLQSFYFFNCYSSIHFCDSLKEFNVTKPFKIEQCLWDSLEYDGDKLDPGLFFLEFNNVKIGNVVDRFVVRYDVKWPYTQILSLTVQKRYSNVFSFLAKLHQAQRDLISLRSEQKKTIKRLKLQAFIHSFQDYCVNIVLRPLLEFQWKNMKSLDDVYKKIMVQLEEVERMLFLNNPVKDSIMVIFGHCVNGIVDDDTMRFIRDALKSESGFNMLI